MTNLDNNIITLSISCVYYDSDLSVFQKTIEHLLTSVNYAKKNGIIHFSELHLINNNFKKNSEFLIFSEKLESLFDKLVLHTGHGNIGYGQGNNMAINEINSKYHLILNPDVYQEENALFVGISYLEQQDSVCMLTPSAKNETGELEYLAKRQPTLIILILRAIDIPILNKFFSAQLNWYTYKDIIFRESCFDIELASGCFMLIRTATLKKVKGFSEKYFLYFEDFDLSCRLAKHGKIMFLSSIKIIHLGGRTSKKGLKHTILFLKSLTIFLTHRYYLRLVN
jgi:hypothetical protein